jgi:hypothetical protein
VTIIVSGVDLVRLVVAILAVVLAALALACAAHRRRDLVALGFVSLALFGVVTAWGQVDLIGSPATLRTGLVLVAITLAVAYSVLTIARGVAAARGRGAGT